MQDNENKKGLSSLEAATEINSSSGKEALAPIVKAGVPNHFNIMRAFSNRYLEIEKELFQMLLKDGNKLEFSEDTLCAFCIAIAHKLYNDSYATGRAKQMNIGRALTEGDKVQITITFAELIKFGYGIKSIDKHRDELKALMETLDSTPLFSLDTEGSGKGKYLMKIEEWTIEKYKAAAVTLRINKVFCNRLEGYGRYYADVLERLVEEASKAGKGLTSMDRRFLLYIGQHNKTKPQTIPLTELVERLGKKDEYKKFGKRVEISLTKLFVRFMKVGILRDFKNDDFGNITFFYPSNKKAPENKNRGISEGKKE